jgi:hypothetical protein
MLSTARQRREQEHGPMPTIHLALASFVLAAGAATGPAASRQAHQDPTPILAAQREAMKRLAFMDGVWRGKGWMMLPSGEKQTITQTERVGPMLDGAVRVIEGRGYDDGGELKFNALAIVSFDPAKDAFTLRSYARGQTGDFSLARTEDGFTWEIPAGPATIRYTATIKDGTWHEVGDRIVSGGEPVRFFEMTLRRLADTDWPAAGAIGPP